MVNVCIQNIFRCFNNDPSLQTRSLHWLNQYFNFYTDILLFFMSYKIIDIVLYTHSIDDTYIINPD